MRSQGRLTDLELVNIVYGYSVELKPMIELAKQYGITRQGVYKVLHQAGIDTSKAGAGNMDVSCTCCAKVFSKHRCQVRRQKHVFCSEECYFAWLKHGNGKPFIKNEHGKRVARKVVSKYFTVLLGQVVHHEDRNQFNNHIKNLKVFANNGDHVRHHRGFIVNILFDGSMVAE